MTERVPTALAEIVQSTLGPVRPLAAPWRRALTLAPLAALTLVAASWAFSLRRDANVLGWLPSWGLSAAQAGLALALVGLALREAVPGRALRPPTVVLAAGAMLGFSAVVTLRTWMLSPTTIAQGLAGYVGQICFAGTVVTAIPLLAGAALLASRAYVLRAWSAGALYGLGAGLAADAGWRLFCHYSEPGHVFATHTGAVVATMLAGIAMASAAGRRPRS